MKPDRNNYEIWIIDYLDGKLSARDAGLLMEFLDNNPDIKEDFENLKMIALEPSDERYQNKQELARGLGNLPDDQFEILCIGHLEGDLTAGQEAELQQIIAENPAKKHSFELTGKLRLSPPAGKYNFKRNLKKLTNGARVFRLTAAILSSAAAITVFLIWLFPSQKPEPGMTALNKPEPDPDPFSIEMPPPLIEEPSRQSETAAQKTISVPEETTPLRLPETEKINLSFVSYKEDVRTAPGCLPSLAAVRI
ncbi:MAG TPA: hypothetical protein PL040_11055, partial [Bacteroidales bacterium]|nr:hypothetical protein [Bacteroidales bacterium]